MRSGLATLLVLFVILLPNGNGALADETSASLLVRPWRFQYPSLYPEGRFEFEPGMELTYLDQGEGFPVVFLHGLACDHHQWNLNMPALERDFRVLAIDFPGHGKSDRQDGYEYGVPKFAAAVLALLDEREIERAVLVGNSMGGHVALWLARHHADRVERLVLVDPAGVLPLADWKLGAAHAALDSDLPAVVGPFTSRFLDGFIVTRGQETPIVRELRAKIVADLDCKDSREGLVEVLDASLRSIEEHTFESRDLRRIRQRTLICWGTDDFLLPVSHAFHLRRRLPRSRLIVYPFVGHVPSVEVPDRFNRSMVRFLEDLRD